MRERGWARRQRPTRPQQQPIWWPRERGWRTRCAARPGITPGRRSSAVAATSTTPPLRLPNYARPASSEWPSSTSMPITATGRRPSSGTTPRVLRIGPRRSGCRLVPAHRRSRRRGRRHVDQSQRAGRPGHDGRGMGGSVRVVACGRGEVRTRCGCRVARCRCCPRTIRTVLCSSPTLASVRSVG